MVCRVSWSVGCHGWQGVMVGRVLWLGCHGWQGVVVGVIVSRVACRYISWLTVMCTYV